MHTQSIFIATFVCLTIGSSLVSALALPKSDCPKDFKRIGNKCYWFSHHQTLNWFEANLKCRRMNSFLLTIENGAELVLISEKLRAMNSPYVWTSYNDLGEEGEYYSMSSGQRMNFAAWDHQNNQPDNYQDSEHCVHLSYVRLGKYVMNDYDCGSRLYFVCERLYGDAERKYLEHQAQ